MDYAKAYRKMAHTGLHFRGLSLLQHVDQIAALVRLTDSRTLLDYGSGAGEAYGKGHRVHERWGMPMPTRYDPAFPKLAKKPEGTFHGVISTDVLEHIPEAEVDAFIARLFGYAERFVFCSVCCRPAGKTFPNGKNLHVTVRLFEWWQDKMRAHAKPGVEWRLEETP